MSAGEVGPTRSASHTLALGLPHGSPRALEVSLLKADSRPADALTWLGELRGQRPGLGLGGVGPTQRSGCSQLGGRTRWRWRLGRLGGWRRLRGGGGRGVPRRRWPWQSPQRVRDQALQALVGLLPAKRHLSRHDPLPLDDQDAFLAGAVLEATVALVALEPGQHPVVPAASALRRALQGRPRRLRHRAAHVQVGGAVAVHAQGSPRPAAAAGRQELDRGAGRPVPGGLGRSAAAGGTAAVSPAPEAFAA